MIELETQEYAVALPLLEGIRQAVVSYAICEGVNPARVFIDRRDDPYTALIWTPVGYYFLGGNPERVRHQEEITRTITETFIPASQELGETGFILVGSSETWQKELDKLLPERQIEVIYRRPFVLDHDKFKRRGSWRKGIPAGLRLLEMDEALAEKAGVLSTWKSGQDFVKMGTGFALLDGEEIASACSSIFASSGRVEIDLHTGEKYRRRGLALITASALIETCLE
jgi:hypothetical protein